MLTRLRSSTAVPKPETDAVDMLLACHDRIRNFTGIALRLADAEAAGEDAIANAAEAVHRYYAVALPLHEADENESVYPRLQRRLTDPQERSSVQSMVDQHGPIDEIVARLLPVWNELQTNPAQLAAHAESMRAQAQRLQDLWTEHLALEEKIIFPLIRDRLTPEELSEIQREMKQRRQ